MTSEFDERMRRHEEALKMCFEGCKHTTTISAVAAGILVAIYREDVIDSALLAIAMAALMLSILTALIGLLVTPMGFIDGTDWDLPLAYAMLFVSIDLFAAGVLTALLEALDWPNWLNFLIGSFVGACLISVIIVPRVRRSASQGSGD